MFPSENEENLIDLLTLFKEKTLKRRALVGKTENDSNRFNLFKVVSDRFHREKLHSAILAFLLEKAPRFWEVFLADLDESKDTYLQETKGTHLQDYFNTTEPVNILLEDGQKGDGFIDVLIHNHKYAIIVENKLNRARDMNDQLCRYYHYVTEKKKLQVVGLVYMPLEHNKKPPIESYDCSRCTREKCEKTGKETLDSLTVVFPVQKLVASLTRWEIETQREQEDNFLKDLHMFVRHYIDLLTQLGAQAMTFNHDKEIVREIFSNPHHLHAAAELNDIWQHLHSYLQPLVDEGICQGLCQKGYERVKDNIWQSPQESLVKNLQKNRFFRRIIYNPEWCTFALEPNGEEPVAVAAAETILSKITCPYLTGIRPSRAPFMHRNFVFKAPSLQTLNQIIIVCLECFDSLEMAAAQYQDGE